LVILIVLKHFDPAPVWAIVTGAVSPGAMNGSPVLFPVALLLYYAVLLNLMLMAFNLIPLPPLDGSHIVRHMLPYNWLRVYDSIGMIGLVVIFVFGGRFIDGIVGPLLSVFNHILLSM
jgi:Zn-dependent protease